MLIGFDSTSNKARKTYSFNLDKQRFLCAHSK